MSEHRVPYSELDARLRQIIDGGEKIGHVDLEWIITTEDRVETRPYADTHAARLGLETRPA